MTSIDDPIVVPVVDEESESFFALVEQALSKDEINLSSSLTESEFIEEIVPRLSRSNWKSIYLSGNGLTCQAMKQLSSHVIASQVTTLDLQDNFVGDCGLSELSPSLSFMTSLTMLHLDSNNITANSAVHLQMLLTSPVHQLRELTLDNNFFLGDHGLAVIAQALPFSKLEVLSVENCNISARSAHALAMSLPLVPTLQILSLERNNIQDVGVQALASVLRKCAKLEILSLGSNMVTDMGVHYIARELMSAGKQCSIQGLGLASNEITDAGVDHLVQCLPRCRLKAVTLARNRFISDLSAMRLAACLRDCRYLRAIRLSDNQITDAGVQALIQGTKLSSSTLSLISVTGNEQVSLKCEETLLRLLKTTQTKWFTVATRVVACRTLPQYSAQSGFAALPLDLIRMILMTIQPKGLRDARCVVST